MRVFLKRTFDNEYASPNFAVAADGFRTMGWFLAHYQDSATILAKLSREDVVVDFMDESRQALKHLGVEPPTVATYPESLSRFLGRRIWSSTIDTIASAPDKWPIFVKPKDDAKNFTGVLVRGTKDLVGCGDPSQDTPVWCSEPVRFLAEWRVFIRYGRIVGVRPYRGDWRKHFDPKVIEDAVAAWADKPRGCAVDFGLDDAGRTLLIEANEGFAIGSYGLPPVEYAKLLSARWTEVTGTKDECDF